MKDNKKDVKSKSDKNEKKIKQNDKNENTNKQQKIENNIHDHKHDESKDESTVNNKPIQPTTENKVIDHQNINDNNVLITNQHTTEKKR